MKAITHPTILNMKEYDERFPDSVREEALNNILDIRKFEIEMYWKRATYFWTFIGVAFAGYIALSTAKEPNDKGMYAVLLLGIVFSLCWYLVNRGSKFWQLNWEKHLDAIEDNQIGPLYKTTIERSHYKSKWYIVNAPYPYSVSKINILLSFFMLVLWIGLLVDFISVHENLFDINVDFPFNYFGYTGLLSALFIVAVIIFGQTGKFKDDEFKTHIHFDRRTFSEEKEVNEENG